MWDFLYGWWDCFMEDSYALDDGLACWNDDDDGCDGPGWRGADGFGPGEGYGRPHGGGAVGAGEYAAGAGKEDRVRECGGDAGEVSGALYDVERAGEEWRGRGSCARSTS